MNDLLSHEFSRSELRQHKLVAITSSFRLWLSEYCCSNLNLKFRHGQIFSCCFGLWFLALLMRQDCYSVTRFYGDIQNLFLQLKSSNSSFDDYLASFIKVYALIGLHCPRLGLAISEQVAKLVNSIMVNFGRNQRVA